MLSFLPRQLVTTMMLPACLTALLALQVTTALANTEKLIFLAPAVITLPDTGPTLHALHLDTLSPKSPTLRKGLAVAFPTQDRPQGLESWYLLQGLSAARRYEIRICWPAVQPTEFWLETYKISHVFDTPALIQGLAAFAEQQVQPSADRELRRSQPLESLLFLKVQAAADYFTTNKTLMLRPQPVDIDIILDPYLANIFPASLLPTAIYIVGLAILSFYVSGWIWRTLQSQTLSKQRTD